MANNSYSCAVWVASENLTAPLQMGNEVRIMKFSSQLAKSADSIQQSLTVLERLIDVAIVLLVAGIVLVLFVAGIYSAGGLLNTLLSL